MPTPTAHHSQLVAAACRQIEASDAPPELSALAERAGLSPWHFHRVFKAVTGLTPRSYASARRAQKVREQLQQGKSVTETLYASGFNSSGRFYEAANGMLGMTPAAFRQGGSKASIHFALAQCSLGAVLVACSERGVCAILLGDEPQALLDDLQRRFPKAALIGADSDFEAIVAKVLGFIEAPRAGLDLPLDIRGTAFQQRVWQALGKIEPGTTASYAQVAASIGAPSAVRAVAGACAANALAVAVPCHRVVRTDGGLSGYRWGIERKRELLERERRPDTP
ncbi:MULTISPECIES: bifunctional DNA-binding transcriptional regulator/O6-methylguanine-DNA methyltransferase Ada [unclassified Pseudomonas]|uniref:bifunctional DNA-binding transcriptional regulator/O6-methylguanine-DNA methyltransferase Ada n=1 Tax=unclassified Pseudomonas TaxID=196821 RepID=UPI000F016B31|nr:MULTISPECIES: bifunctional DNA-binding transcriptional regulator/O6-methylguanine-DNA methyltransferase Ada [unclassified Pseudomonas]MBD8624748.1 bifunctional DNA-binding transcriptional regulator/O6-methylguanine-DNA methyltransferase Ada [Pseudomonas sp. CFBP 13727]MBD8824899.1 bifunctional DNA-binding transcriptional regulator/O6-methylguanine-DNA methyltransferase Ada [Pseudomonas sp. CFBP 13602]